MTPKLTVSPKTPKKKVYNVHSHTKDLALDTDLRKYLTRVDRLMSLVPGRVVYDFKNDPYRK